MAAGFLLLGAGLIELLARPPVGQPVILIAPPTALPLTVDVSGAVVNPGVYQLSQGSRVQDAIQAAGGFQPEADLGAVNQAQELVDGTRLQIPFLPTPVPTSQPGERSQAFDIPTTVPEISTQPGLININTASQAQLESLPRIGPVTAQKIIAYREANGPFKKIEDLMDVSGIGPATLEAIRELITVGP